MIFDERLHEGQRSTVAIEEENTMINEEILNIVLKNYVYSVVGECNGCQLCEYLAVNNFARVRGGSGFEVVRQPETWEEKEQCQEAMERCSLRGIVRTERAISRSDS